MDDPLARLDAAIARRAALTRDRVRTGTTHDDAGDVTGTVATDDAIGFDPRPLIRAHPSRAPGRANLLPWMPHARPWSRR